jgi:hypothetical protein
MSLRPTSRRKRRPVPARREPNRPDPRRQALELLASCPDGATDTLLMAAHGLITEMLIDLIRAGLATGRTEQLVIAGHTTEVTRVRITDAGRWALVPGLTLKRAPAPRTSEEWHDDDYYVMADGAVVGRIIHVPSAPKPTPWMWTLAYGYHENRTPTHGYAPTREAAMAAFAKSWRRE